MKIPGYTSARIGFSSLDVGKGACKVLNEFFDIPYYKFTKNARMPRPATR